VDYRYLDPEHGPVIDSVEGDYACLFEKISVLRHHPEVVLHLLASSRREVGAQDHHRRSSGINPTYQQDNVLFASGLMR
jgi:hypothetical protein